MNLQDQGTNEKSRIMQNNNRLPLETKVDELELPPSNPHSVQIERGAKFPSPKNPNELGSFESVSASPIYREGMDSPFSGNIGKQATSIEQDQYLYANRESQGHVIETSMIENEYKDSGLSSNFLVLTLKRKR